MHISLKWSGRVDPAGSASARQQALSWPTSAAGPGATPNGFNPRTATLWGWGCGGHSFLLDKQGQAGFLLTCRPPGRTGNVDSNVAPRPNRATAHYDCAGGRDRQDRQRVAITDPVGWIWFLNAAKGGARGRAGVGQGEFVSQARCAKTGVVLIK